MPEKVREEVTPFFTSKLSIAIADNDSERIEKLGEETVEMISSDLEVSLYTCQCQSHMMNSANTYVKCFHFALQPRWSDMDANQHVNNVKYIGWILEVTCNSKLIKIS